MNYSSITVQKLFNNLSIFIDVLTGEEKRGQDGEIMKVKESLVGNVSSVQYLSGKDWVDLPANIDKILEEYHQLKKNQVENAKAI